MVILAAVSGERQQERVVDVGHDLATAYGDELVVLHVMDQSQFEEIRSEGRSGPLVVPSTDEEGGIAYVSDDREVSEYDLEDAESDAAAVAQETVDGTLDLTQQDDVRTVGRVGDPATEIVEEGQRIDARYVVVGGRKRSPTGKAIFGSVSQSVILEGDRPIVAITSDEE